MFTYSVTKILLFRGEFVPVSFHTPPLQLMYLLASLKTVHLPTVNRIKINVIKTTLLLNENLNNINSFSKSHG